MVCFSDPKFVIFAFESQNPQLEGANTEIDLDLFLGELSDTVEFDLNPRSPDCYLTQSVPLSKNKYLVIST